MKLFELSASGPTAGDCTTPYNVVFYRECTVREFIDEVLTRNEWGTITIGDWLNGPSISYRNDKITSGAFSNDILDHTIKSATSHGGWSAMDYILQPWDKKEKLRAEYALTLKDIVRHESAIKQLQIKARALEAEMEKAENPDTPPPHLDRDGCVYWDSILVKNEEENDNES